MNTVLLTRPDGENESLQQLLVEERVTTIVRPLIELSAIDVSSEAKQLAMDLDQQDIIIFVSKSAVRFALPLLESYWPQWPMALSWLAVGPGTSAALAEFGIQAQHPELAGSEGLLQLSELTDVTGQNVMIARGVGGRALLADELQNRGALVTYLETYQRTPVTYADWTDIPENSVIAVTSLEALNNLKSQLAADTNKHRVVVVSERIATQADGFAETIIAAGASDQALYDAILKCV